MAGLSTILTAYRAALVTAGFTHIPETFEIDDLPATAMNQVFELIVSAHRPVIAGGVYGGGHMDFDAECVLHFVWNAHIDAEAVYNTVATDLEAATVVMLKASNRQTNQLSPFYPAAGFVIEETQDHSQIHARGTFTVRYRMTEDVT